jgi:hypothetical protein
MTELEGDPKTAASLASGGFVILPPSYSFFGLFGYQPTGAFGFETNSYDIADLIVAPMQAVGEGAYAYYSITTTDPYGSPMALSGFIEFQ